MFVLVFDLASYPTLSTLLTCETLPRSSSEGSFVRKTQLGEVGGKVWQGAVSKDNYDSFNRLLGTVNVLCQALKYVGYAMSRC